MPQIKLDRFGDRDNGYGRLVDYQTTDVIRAATKEEQEASRAAAERDGGRGVIEVDGRRCYVED